MQYKYATTDDQEIVLAPYRKDRFIDGPLPSGFYSASNVGSPFGPPIPLFKVVRSIDNLVRFKTGLISDVVRKADAFLSPAVREVYEEMGVGHKVGMLFYGKPGTGKTCSCRLIIDEMIEKYQAIALDGTGGSIGWMLTVIQLIREQQSNPVVLFVDEFERSVGSEEGSYLTFLDGTTSVSNLIFIACTNYIQKIPDRIKHRKSRIKYTYNIDSLPLPVYEEYLKEKCKRLSPEQLVSFALKAHKLSITLDELKHSVLDYIIDKVTVDEAIKQATSNTNVVSFNETKQIDFADRLASKMAALMIGGTSVIAAKDKVIAKIYDGEVSDEEDKLVNNIDNQVESIGEEAEEGGSQEEDEESMDNDSDEEDATNEKAVFSSLDAMAATVEPVTLSQ